MIVSVVMATSDLLAEADEAPREREEEGGEPEEREIHGETFGSSTSRSR